MRQSIHTSISRYLIALGLISFCAYLLGNETLLAQDPASCKLGFTGSNRKFVKNRKPKEGKYYFTENKGKPIDLKDFLSMTAYYDKQMPDYPEVNSYSGNSGKTRNPNDKVVPKVETTVATVEGWLMGAKLAPDDNDLHIEIGTTAKKNSPRMIIEIPSRQEYCEARKVLWSLIEEDAEHAGKSPGKKWLMETPVKVRATGFVYVDIHHARKATKEYKAYRKDSGGRGMRDSKKRAYVNTCYELHPILSLEPIN